MGRVGPQFSGRARAWAVGIDREHAFPQLSPPLAHPSTHTGEQTEVEDDEL
jgi:hypothetical protein